MKKYLVIIIVGLSFLNAANARTVTCTSSSHRGDVYLDERDLQSLINTKTVTLPLVESINEGEIDWQESYRIRMLNIVGSLIEIEINLDSSGYSAFYEGADELSEGDYGSSSGSSMSLSGKRMDYWEGYRGMKISVMSNGGSTHLRGISDKLECFVNN